MICILLSVRYSVTAFVATIGTRYGKYTSRDPLWKCSCQIFNVFFYFRKRRKIKKTFFLRVLRYILVNSCANLTPSSALLLHGIWRVTQYLWTSL